MPRLPLLASLLLGGCAGTLHTLDVPMHAQGTVQVGWEERKADDGNPLIVVKSAGNLPYADLVQVAEKHAAARCPYGYRVISVDGGDQPQQDILKPRFILGSEVRFKVQCFARDSF